MAESTACPRREVPADGSFIPADPSSDSDAPQRHIGLERREYVIAVVWQMEIHAEKADEFEQLYGASGQWTKLSRRSRSFLGSSFLRDLASETRYVLVEYWSEMVVYERHLAEFGREVKALEDTRDRLVARVYPLGVFTALDVPDRFGPTWSQRS